MDFVFGLLLVNGYNRIMLIVQKISKMVQLISVKDFVINEGTTKLVWDNMVTKHGVPLSIVSDRDSRFTSGYWAKH